MAIPTITTEAFEEFVNRPEHAEQRFELIGGEIVEVPSNPYCSQIAMRIVGFLFMYLQQHDIGHVTGEGGGYRVYGERYAPDVAFVSKARQPQLAREGYNPIAPDLAVEVISPTDKPQNLRIKIANYLAAGTLVWVVYPEARQVEVYPPGKPAFVLGIDAALDGGDVLPGFTLPVRDVFPPEA